MVLVARREDLSITPEELRKLQGATPAQIDLATRLIKQGKAGAARGDPILQPIINALAGFGVTSIASQRFRAEAVARQQQIAQRLAEQQRIKEQAQQGTIFLKPSERGFAQALAEKTGARVIIPRTREKFTPRGRGSIFLTPSELKFAEELRRKTSAKIFIPEKITLTNLKSRTSGVGMPSLSQKIITSIRSKLDVVSGGFFTRKDIKNQQNNLNRQVELFNKQFGGRTLTEQEFKKAQTLSIFFEQKQKEIEDMKKKFKESKTGKFRSFLQLSEEDPLFFNFDKAIKTKSKNLSKTKGKIENLKGKTGVVANLNRKRLKSIEKDQKKAIRDLQAGIVPVLIKGTAPLTPIGTFPKSARIVFVGRQKQVGNKIITDIVFKVGKKTIGTAKGVSVIKGKKAVSIVIGRTGVKVARFPSAKITTVKRKSFIAIEKAITKQADVKLRKVITLLKRKRKIGTINVIKSNLRALQQRSLGQIVAVRGDKIFRTGIKFPTGKIIKRKGKGLTLDTFASISSIFTKKELSLIIGKTITARGNKAKFIGIIKGTSIAKTGKGGLVLNNIQQQQFKVALNKVIAAASSSVAQSSKIKGLSKIGRIATASTIAVQTARARQITRVKQKPKQITRVKQKPRQITRTKQIAGQILRVSQKAKQGLRTAQTPAQIARQITGLQTKQAQKLSTSQLNALKQALLAGTGTSIGTSVGVLRVIPVLIPKIKRRVKKKIVKRLQPTFNVFAKSKGKFIRLNTRPLSRAGAKRLGSKVVDNTLSRTFRLKPTGKKKKLGKAMGTFKKQKFRTFKIRKKKKIGLRRTFIEKRKFAIDTKGERKGLSVAKFLKQQRRPQKRKSSPRRPIQRKPTSIKRQFNSRSRRPAPSQAQLSALERGRKIMMRNRGNR